MTAVAHRINGERLVLLGWTRAILMQVAHPLIAAGVSDHSSFRDSALAPVRRLHATVRAMLGLAFGSDQEQARVIDGIRSIHTRVHGTLGEAVGRYPAGTRYSAEDPALLLWVHATLIETNITVYEAVVGALTTADRDEYCRQSAAVAVALGADAASVPRDWAMMTRYVQAMLRSSDLTVGPDARALAQALLHTPAVRIAGPVGWASRQLTVGWLPADLRAQYGLAWDARRERRFLRTVGAIRRVRPLIPAVAARWRAATRLSSS